MHKNRTPTPNEVEPYQARRAIEAILAVLECDDVDGKDRERLEDAKTILKQWDGSY